MNDVWPDKCGVYILDNESTATQFIDEKIKELDSKVIKSLDLSLILKSNFQMWALLYQFRTVKTLSRC